MSTRGGQWVGGLVMALFASLPGACTGTLGGARDAASGDTTDAVAMPGDLLRDQASREDGAPSAGDMGDTLLTNDTTTAPDRTVAAPCQPLPAACLCPAACQQGQCDNSRCPCAPIAGQSYGKLPTAQTSSQDPATHVDVNLLLRQAKPVNKTLGLVQISGPTDYAPPPLLHTIFQDERVPAFPAVYQVEAWDWGCKCFTGFLQSPEVTLAGMATTPGEVLRVPHSGYNIGQGKTALVLYAAPNTITLKYTGEDNVVKGYTVHISGVCIEPSLQALYDTLHAAGRGELPALASRQPFGRALGAEIRVAIRDTGSWMDPRSKKDWWQGK